MRTPIRETPGNFAAQAFQSVTDSERNRLQLLLNQFTGYPVAAFNFVGSADDRRQALARYFIGRLNNAPTSHHPFLLAQWERQALVNAVGGLCLSDVARAAEAALRQIRKERGEAL